MFLYKDVERQKTFKKRKMWLERNAK